MDTRASRLLLTTTDRRITPRIRVRLPGRVDTDGDQRHPVEVIDLSASGAQVGCSYLSAGHIIPRDRSMVDAVGFALRLAIGFDGDAPGDEVETIDAVVAYSRRVAQDDYRFGLRFGRMSEPLRERLLACLDAAQTSGPGV